MGEGRANAGSRPPWTWCKGFKALRASVVSPRERRHERLGKGSREAANCPLCPTGNAALSRQGLGGGQLVSSIRQLLCSTSAVANSPAGLTTDSVPPVNYSASGEARAWLRSSVRWPSRWIAGISAGGQQGDGRRG